ncbi:unnamed protein product [Notodromas monacha]|uniref:Uncharacterized protein n=1 Tax=Notodromas monacha TaxID=399045 RepID=A0A7R9GKQ2_9CRUS|nr:unnamed protein product [Notodromas monacha]CAG0924867.1 unnamed protein product [Notodromas monacha]
MDEISADDQLVNDYNGSVSNKDIEDIERADDDCGENFPVPSSLQGLCPKTFYEIKAEDPCGDLVCFKDYCGKVVLVVNTASL